MKMMPPVFSCSLLLVLIYLLPVTSISIPEVTPEECLDFNVLFEEAINYHMQFITASSFQKYTDCPSFQKLANQGPKILAYLVSSDLFQQSNSEQPSEFQANDIYAISKRSVFRALWLCGFGRPLMSPFVPWVSEQPEDIWRGGQTVANIRTAFILSEWRLARQNGHAADERLAAQTLRCLGLSAYDVLFQDLSDGYNDVLDIFTFINQRDHRWEKDDRDWLLKWWIDNRNSYRLPAMDPSYPVSQLGLDEWKRYNF